MKKVFLACMMVLAISALCAKEISLGQGASVEVTSRTSFGVDIDDPYKYGLAQEFPRLGFAFKVSPYQVVANKVKTDDPYGFIEFTLNPLEIRFNNGAWPDYNNPGQTTKWQFNQGTVYFSPVYLYNMRTGIAWGDWVLQLDAQGNYGDSGDTWFAWNRDMSHFRESIVNSWAYLDTRTQYTRGPIISSDANKDDYVLDWWSIRGTGTGPGNTQYDGLYQGPEPTAAESLQPTVLNKVPTSGSMIGLQYSNGGLATLLKLATQYSWNTTTQTSPSNPNGIALGDDYSFSSTNIKGLRIMGSLTYLYDYSSEPKNPLMSGTKVGYDIPWPGVDGVSLEPYVGYDLKINTTQDNLIGHEIAGGLTIHWPGTDGWGTDYLAQQPGNIHSGLSIAYKLLNRDLSSSTMTHNIVVTLFEDDGDEGLFPGLGAELALEMIDLTNSAAQDNYRLSSYFSYQFNNVIGGNLIPWTRVFYDNDDVSGSRFNRLSFDLGLRLEKSIPNTTFGMTWESRDVLQTTSNPKLWGTIKTFIEITL